jgi:hypothetical protein
MSENPFERFDLDPRLGPAEITRRLRELGEDARNGPERDALRAAWEALTVHPWRRLEAAVAAHPESRAPLGAPPMRRRVAAIAPPTAQDVAPRRRVGPARFEVDLLAPAPLDEDPILTEKP